MRRWIYLGPVMPATVLAAEALSHMVESDGLLTILIQWGLGAIVGLVAVWMLLTLYKDKEQGMREYHGQLLELTRDQINAIRDTKNTLDKVESTLEEHNREFMRFLDEMRRLNR